MKTITVQIKVTIENKDEEYLVEADLLEDCRISISGDPYPGDFQNISELFKSGIECAKKYKGRNLSP